MSDNIKVKVESYNLSGLALLTNYLKVTKLANGKYKNYTALTGSGQRGDNILMRIPTKIKIQDGLTFDLTAAPNSNDSADIEERFWSLTVGGSDLNGKSQKKHCKVAFDDSEMAEYGSDQLLENGKPQLKALASKIDLEVAQNLVMGAALFEGDIDANVSKSNSTAVKFRESVVRARNYGGQDEMTALISDVASANIASSTAQEFTPIRNNKVLADLNLLAFDGDENTAVMKYQRLPNWISGTGANNVINTTTGITVDAVADSTFNIGSISQPNYPSTDITLDGLTNGESIRIGDLIEIGRLSGSGTTNLGKVKLLNLVDNEPTIKFPQGRVVAIDPAYAQDDPATNNTKKMGVVAAGKVKFTIINAWLFNATNTQSNMNTISRAIVTGVNGDKVQIVKDHKRGIIFYRTAFFFACPKLPERTPFPTGTKIDPDTGISLRTYYGAIFQSAKSYMVSDTEFGTTLVAEYGTALILPTDG
jgi:hypothetical protein